MEVVVSASQGVMGSLLGKLGALLTDEYKLQKGVKGEVMFLKAELEAIHAFLQDIDKVEEPSALLKLWMRDVRELSYDMEDCIDDFMLRLHADPNSKPPGFRGFMERTMKLLTKTKTCHRIGTEIQDLKSRVAEVSERRARYRLDEAVSKPGNAVAVDPRVRFLHVNAADLVGIEGPRDELVKWLTEERQQQLKVLSIVGFGGLGKTTLANEVYRQLRGQFECSAFVSVSQKPELKKIFRKILDQVGPKDRSNAEAWDENELINRIKEFLKDKRYFIVIDDIWSTTAWRTIKCALVENNCRSRIITTTRNLIVAKSCCTTYHDRIYKMHLLDTIDAGKLFFKRTFGCEERCPTQLNKVSFEILKKCGGLPLAIITIASLLTNKSNTNEQWERVRNSIGSGLETNSDVEEMKNILLLSYNDLPHCLKTCLLYLSVFPEDYEIERDELVRRWIAEGFISAEGEKDLVEVGESYFNELINRSMIQPAIIWTFDRELSYRVHDMILDLIISKSFEANFVTLFGEQREGSVPQCKVRRLFLNYRDGYHVKLPSSIILSHARSLIVYGNAKHIPPLLNFHSLRVLVLHVDGKLDNNNFKNIVRLCQLKYLRLVGRLIMELPENIGDLQCLETLDLGETSIQELPTGIVQLQKLERLFVGSIIWPNGIGKLHALRELSADIDDECSFDLVQELSDLIELRTLKINWNVTGSRCDFGNYRNSLVSSLNKLSGLNLRSVYIWSRDNNFPLDSWTPSPNLQRFEMRTNHYFAATPEWVTLLPNLTHLDININQLGEEDLQVLRDLHGLRILFLSSKAAPKERLTIGSKGFQSLKEFCLVHLYCGMPLVFVAGAMPKLELLRLHFNAQETKSVYGDFDFGIQNLSPSLTHVKICCDGVECRMMEAAIRNAANVHPNHPTVDFKCYGYTAEEVEKRRSCGRMRLLSSRLLLHQSLHKFLQLSNPSEQGGRKQQQQIQSQKDILISSASASPVIFL